MFFIWYHILGFFLGGIIKMENENINNQGPVIDQNPSSPIGNAKLFSILSYIPFLWIIGLLVEPEKNDPFVRNHVNNGIIITIFSALCFIPYVGWYVISTILLITIIFGIIAASQGRTFNIPIVGDKLQIIK